MEKRRIPEAVYRTKPDVSSTSAISRSKSTISPSTTTNSQSKSRIRELLAPTRSSLIEKNSISSPSTRRAKNRTPDENPVVPIPQKASRFSSIKEPSGSVNRAKPNIDSISSSVSRVKTSSTQLQSPEVGESVGSTRDFPSRRPITFSEL